MRLIDADALKNDFDVQYFINNERVFDIPQIKAFIDISPTVEAKPVVHGNWIYIPGLQPGWRCSNCGSAFTMQYQHNYCPHCGADMRGGKNERNTD